MDPLACSSCGRAFPSALPLERHRLRCKFRPRAARKKACGECARSKVRCDQKQPVCSRCRAHSLPCAYPQQPDVDEQGGDAIGAPTTPMHPPDATIHWEVTASGLQTWHAPLAATPSQAVNLIPMKGWTTSDTDIGLDGGLSFLFPDDLELNNSSPTPVPLPLLAIGIGPHTADAAAGNPWPALIWNSGPHANSENNDGFRNLSAFLTARSWITREQGIDLVDAAYSSYIDALIDGRLRVPFIHSRDWDPVRRSEPLAGAVVIAQLAAVSTRTPQMDRIIVDIVEAQLPRISLKIWRNTHAEDVAALHGILLNCATRVYRTGPIAAELVDRVAARNLQHIFGKSMRVLTPYTNATPNEWEQWIIDESIRRGFFAAHALEYAIHARQGLPTALCGLFPDALLPCPAAVWEAPTAEEWATQHRAWEETWGSGSDDGGNQPLPLKAGDILSWLRGKETGREDRLAAWFCSGTGLEDLIFVCGRAQAGAVGAEGLGLS